MESKTILSYDTCTSFHNVGSDNDFRKKKYLTKIYRSLPELIFWVLVAFIKLRTQLGVRYIETRCNGKQYLCTSSL